MNPFPLSASDYSQFMNEAGPALSGLPSWGGIIEWHNRYVLAFYDAVGNWRLTDISGGVPTSRGTVPISALLSDIPRTETPAWEVFLYTLPGNFLDVATERAGQIAAAGGSVVDAAIKPLLPDLMPLAVIAVAVLAFMYLPRAKS
jgi:hypothetical protein